MAFPFPAKAPDEKKLLTFDFSTEAAVGSVLTNPTVVAITTFGDDPSAASLLITNIVVTSPQKVQCFADGGLEGCHYEFHAECDADNGEHHEIVAQLKVHLSAARGK